MISQERPQVTEHFNAKTDVMELQAGDRYLVVKLPQDDSKEFMTVIVKLYREEKKEPGATTALYERANEIMQETADRTGETFTYIMSTGNPKMVQWARAHGKRIFDWSVEFDVDDEFGARRIFRPSDHTPED